MKNDEKIKAKAVELKSYLDGFLDYINSFNPCAYSDRILETVIDLSKKLEKLYEDRGNK